MKQIFLVLVLLISCSNSQVVNNVRVVNHADYIVKVIQETVSEVERREWCNLKLPDITTTINETVIDRHYSGTATYSNGFVVSIQQVDVQQSTVQQIWSWNSTESTGTVSLRGTLRMTNLAIGYDVVGEMEDGHHRYTAIYTHPLISFAISINYNTHTQVKDVTAVGAVQRSTTILPNIFPKDTTSEVLTTLFNADLTADGINAWGPNIFQPIIADVVTRVEFPRICYDCPVV